MTSVSKKMIQLKAHLVGDLAWGSEKASARRWWMIWNLNNNYKMWLVRDEATMGPCSKDNSLQNLTVSKRPVEALLSSNQFSLLFVCIYMASGYFIKLLGTSHHLSVDLTGFSSKKTTHISEPRSSCKCRRCPASGIVPRGLSVSAYLILAVLLPFLMQKKPNYWFTKIGLNCWRGRQPKSKPRSNGSACASKLVVNYSFVFLLVCFSV